MPVVIHAVKVIGALHKCFLLCGERGQSVAKLLSHTLGIVAVVDGVGEPSNRELAANFSMERLFSREWLE